MSNVFASRFETVGDTPEPFKQTLRERLRSRETVELLVYVPSSRFGESQTPGTLLAITGQRWLVVTADEEGDAPVTVHQSDYANTLFLVFTSVLLHGCLKIDFATGGGARSVEIYFNTVTEHFYQQATQLVLDHMDGVRAPPVASSPRRRPLTGTLGLKFKNAILRATPEGECVLEVVHCPATLSRKRWWFQRELAPEAVLSLTNRELMVISDERYWSWLPHAGTAKYGSIVMHCPLSRFSWYHFERRESVTSLAVATHAPAGSDTLLVDFPPGKEREIALLMEHAKAGGRPARSACAGT